MENNHNEIVATTAKDVAEVFIAQTNEMLTTKLTDNQRNLFGQYSIKVMEHFGVNAPDEVQAARLQLEIMQLVMANYKPSEVYAIPYDKGDTLELRPSYKAKIDLCIRNNTMGIKRIDFKIYRDGDSVETDALGNHTINTKEPFNQMRKPIGVLINCMKMDGTMIKQGVFDYNKTMIKGKAFAGKAAESPAWVNAQDSMVKRSAWTDFEKEIPMLNNVEVNAHNEITEREFKDAVRAEDKDIKVEAITHTDEITE